MTGETNLKNNKLNSLNDHLFLQLERLSEDCMTEEQIEAEAKRAEAIVDVSEQIIRNADVQFKTVKLIAEHGDHLLNHFPSLKSDKPALEDQS
ncbi:hypothetical protein AB1K62_14575 [Parasphingorhabdus sp. JC815]|uniref:hypothetical protein n=1 Tax=Parasphingorhabdus sp. JC815 TaxID=3232140 RepID=UPI00345B4A94